MRLLRLMAYVAGLCLLLSGPAPLAGQVGFTALIGNGAGTTGYNGLELRGRVNVTGQLYAVGDFEIVGGVWGCAGGPTEEYRCSAEWHSTSLGLTLALVDDDRVYLAARGTGGLFVREPSAFTGTRHFGSAFGVDLEYRVVGSLRVALSVAHRVMWDDTYDSMFGDAPHFTGVSVGFALAPGNRP